MKDLVKELEEQPQKTVPVPLNFSYRGKDYNGVGIPVISSCHDGVCDQLDITLNKKHLGVLKCTTRGWHITDTPTGLAKAIGENVFKWYE